MYNKCLNVSIFRFEVCSWIKRSEAACLRSLVVESLSPNRAKHVYLSSNHKNAVFEPNCYSLYIPKQSQPSLTL